MDPKHLIYFATILDKGSITAASEHLSIAQPTLTRAMATLEMQVGTQLFSRSRYGVKSTPMGERIVREARTIMRAMETANEQVSLYKMGLNTELRLASGPVLGLGVMPDAVERMTKEHPSIALTVTTSRPSDAAEDIRNDKFDAILAPATDDRVHEGIQLVPIAVDTIGIYCGTNHPLVRKKHLEVSDFESADWLGLGFATAFEQKVRELLLAAGVKRIRTKVAFKNEASILIRLLSRGRHLSVLPVLPVRALAEHASLTRLDYELDPQFKLKLYLWVREDKADHPAFIAFSNIVKEVFAELEKVGE